MPKPCILFDIDGTLADTRHRKGFLTTTPKNWLAFFNAAWNDTPIESVVSLYRDLFKTETIIIDSARPEAYRRLTLDWFDRYEIPYGTLLMRPEGDKRDDYLVKRDFLTKVQLMGFTPRFVIDDKPSVVQMFRINGITCFQPNDGSF